VTYNLILDFWDWNLPKTHYYRNNNRFCFQPSHGT